MKIYKRVIAMALALLLVVGCVPMSGYRAFAEETSSSDAAEPETPAALAEVPATPSAPTTGETETPAAEATEPSTPAVDETETPAVQTETPAAQTETPAAEPTGTPAAEATEPSTPAAQPAEDVVYKLTVYFLYENGNTASPKYVAEYDAGDSYSVKVPAVDGYTAYINDAAAGSTVSGTINANTSVEVIYKAKSVSYTVIHRVQSADGSWADHKETLTGKVGAMTEAAAKSEYTTGCAVKADAPVVIVDGKDITIVITYTRLKLTVSFDSNGGTYVSRKTALYGSNFSTASYKPAKEGYTFAGWYFDEALTRKADSFTVTANTTVYAKWTVGTSEYTVNYWLETLTAGKYDFLSAETKTAATGSSVTVGADAAKSRLGSTDYKSYYTFDKADTATVTADGKAVVNVYYRRNVYTLKFNLRSGFSGSGVKITIGGKTYTDAQYSFTAKYGEDISSKWPVAGNISTDSFYGWDPDNSSSNFVTKRFNLTAEMVAGKADGNTINYTAIYKNNLISRNVEYWLENANDNNYTKSETYSEKFNLVWGSTLSAKDLDGFTYNKSKDNVSGTTYKFYYTRNTYDLTFYSDNAVQKKVSKIKFGADISKQEYKLADKEHYTFGGWYTTAACVDGTEFDFTGATMPAANLPLYAKWCPKTYTVKFETDGGTAIADKVVEYGTAVGAIADPEKAGYTFEGWYTDSSFTDEFDVNTPVSGNMTVYAKWALITDTTYTVKYLLLDGTELFPTEVFAGTVGATVNAVAKTHDAYISDRTSDSLVLSYIAEENVITFTYDVPKDLVYKVVYVDENGNTLKEGDIQTTDSIQIIVKADAPAGYDPDSAKKTVILANENTPADLDQNIIIFVCTLIDYKISYELDGGIVAGINPIKYNVTTDTFTLINPVRTDYEFLGWSGTGIDELSKEVTVVKGSTGDREYTANWKRIVYHITATMEGDEGVCSIDPIGTSDVNVGDDLDITFAPADKYYVADVIVDGKSVGECGEYGFAEVSDDHTVHVVFAKCAEIKVTAPSENLTYNGEDQTVSGTYTVEGDLFEGDTFTAELEGSGKNVNTIENPVYVIKAVNCKVTDADGNDVTHHYSIETVDGALLILPIELTVTAGSASKTYDGKELTCSDWTVEGELAANDKISSVTVKGSQTEVGTSANVASDAVILGAEGEDVTANYQITYVEGKLEVTAAEPVPEEAPVKPAPSKGNSTGDSSSNTLALILLISSSCAAAFIVISRKRAFVKVK